MGLFVLAACLLVCAWMGVVLVVVGVRGAPSPTLATARVANPRRVEAAAHGLRRAMIWTIGHALRAVAVTVGLVLLLVPCGVVLVLLADLFSCR